MRATVSAAVAVAMLMAPSCATAAASTSPDYKGAWKASKSYKKGALVSYHRAVWIKQKNKKRCGKKAPAVKRGCWKVFVADGTNGTNGTDGTNGKNGTDGANGPTGATGETGQTGAPGQTGATGPAGPPGAEGAPGLSNYSMVTKDYLWSGSEGYTYTDLSCPAGTSVLGVGWTAANPSGMTSGVTVWASFNSAPAGARLNIVNKVAPLPTATFTLTATCATVG